MSREADRDELVPCEAPLFGVERQAEACLDRGPVGLPWLESAQNGSLRMSFSSGVEST